MRILVTDGMDKTAMAQLREHGHEVVEQFYEPDQLGEALRGFDVAVVRSKTKVRKEHIDAAKGGQLKLIIRGGVGVDNIDVDYAKANGIDVKNTPRASSQSVAELAMGHMFACARYLSIAGHTMREGKWEKKAYGKGVELGGKTLGVIGYGRIGQALGRMAQGLGMNVVAYDIYHVEGIECETMHYVTMDELLAQSDVVSLHCPQTAENARMIDAGALAQMKDGAILLNTARGGLLDEQAVADALKNGKLGFYGADAFGTEPLPQASPLRGLPNALLTPHIAWATNEALQRLMDITTNNLRTWLDDRGENIVNA